MAHPLLSAAASYMLDVLCRSKGSFAGLLPELTRRVHRWKLLNSFIEVVLSCNSHPDPRLGELTGDDEEE